MPTYRVTIEEEFEDVIEEIWRSYRSATQSRIMEIEAENEEQAEDLVMAGEGETISEDWDYGDSVDSEYWEAGDTIDSHHVDIRVSNTSTIEEAESQAEASRQQYAEMLAQSRAQHAAWMKSKVYGNAPAVTDSPAWKI